MKENKEQKWVSDNFGTDYNTLFKDYSTPLGSTLIDRNAIEICVIASHSSAHFINAMLQQTVLPAKENTTSPFVMKIYNGNNDHFITSIYDMEERLIAENFDCDFDSLTKLSAMEGISSVQAIGKIPCFTGVSTSLALVDIPSQNYVNYLKQGKDRLIIYLISGEFNLEELKSLEELQKNILEYSENGSEIYFVLDCLDTQWEKISSVPLFLTETKERLGEIGFKTPKFFPTSSVLSLLFRESANTGNEKENFCQEVTKKIVKINSKLEYHFEDFLLDTLPPEYHAQLKLEINEVKDSYSGEEYSNLQEAIYHTGLPSVELGILAFIDKKTGERKGIDGKAPIKPPFDRKKKQKASLYKNPSFNYTTGEGTEVCFFGTKSVGKSTLVNALIKQELLPLSQEMSVEIVTKVQNETDFRPLNNDFSGIFYDCTNISQQKLNYVLNPHLSQIKSEDNIQLVSLEGNIPFLPNSSKKITLIDVPTSETPDILRLKNQLLDKNSKTLVVYLMGDTIGNEEQDFLQSVSQTIEIGGKQAKDRFIFVVNQLENKKESEIADLMGRLCSYLKEIGFHDPTIIAASGKTALEFSCMEYRRKKLSVDTSETEALIEKTNKTRDMHLEQFAVLPEILKKQVAEQLETTKAIYMGDDGLGGDNKNVNEAVIHTGVTVLELAIYEYVKKYGE